MYEYFIYNITNPTIVINSKEQAVEIPAYFNQILHYDINGKCVEMSKNKRYLVGGLNAGVFTDSRAYYSYVPEVTTIAKLDVNNFDRNRRFDIVIKDMSTKTFNYKVEKFNKKKEGCVLEEKDDSYIVK